MTARTAKLFTTGRSQAVRLPREFRFEGEEVFVRRDARTGDVILSRRPPSWDGLVDLYGKDGGVDPGFLDPAERDAGPQVRDPFAGWEE
ncbi:MAG TPA: AbrB/MazE/SpoVT family DNA-binding domain-containing protein [Caulobacteraceae bacterium]|nr:AbrB/MazE/SpoVT family DNA-binding domain-containing protein [Caulobacteraceae bacterium]